MNRILLLITTIFVLFSTVIISVKKPVLDKPVSINSGQIIAQIKEPPTVNQNSKIENVSPPKVETKVTPINTPTKKVVAKVTPTAEQKQQKQPKTQTPKQVKTLVKKELQASPVVEKEPSAPEPTMPESPSVEPKKKVLTEEEEIIAWNKWRSDIQNSIMRDYKVPVPLGTTYNMSFSVDKWGNISNLSVGCGTSYCPKEGTSHIRTLILGLGTKGLLTFPEGTKRIMTTVKGGFVVVDSNPRYSSPEDFSDYEVIKRQVER